jgi:riboflavin synthase
MFSGIIAAVGRITERQTHAAGVRLTVNAGGLDLSDVALGDSIAHNGVCLTVIARDETTFQVDVSDETLSCTVGLDALGEVNLEKALRLADRLGGHLVSGHVDGVGTVASFAPVGNAPAGEAPCWELVIDAPAALARYIARKGSITVNGVSLTTNRVEGSQFSINLIPHTLTATTLHQLMAGAGVNLEVDLIARYCERLLQAEPTQESC